MNEEIKKIIKEELAAKGLDIAEDAAIKAFEAVFDAAPKIAAVSENGVDDFVVQILPFVKPKVIALLEKINPKD